MHIHVHQAPSIDVGLVLALAEQQGYLPPEKAKALKEQVERTQADLEQLRQAGEEWRIQVDAAIEAFNKSDVEGAKAAFARIDALMSERRSQLHAEERTMRLEEARSKHAQATLLYPFEVSRSEPLLTEAAELAETNTWYWIECGRARQQTGKLDPALIAFRTAYDLAHADKQSHDRSAALHGIGEVQVAQGQLDAALDACTESLNIFHNLAAQDSSNADWAHGLSVSLNKVGDVRRAQGQHGAALDAYTESLEIRRNLAAQDPGNASWARAVSVSLNNVGDMWVAQDQLDAALDAFTESLNIVRNLAAQDPGNANLVRDVSISLDRVGNIRFAQGQLDAALEAYNENLDIRRAFAAKDPGNANWVRDVSVSLIKVGDVQFVQGQPNAALDAYTESLNIVRGLLAKDPGNSSWASEVSVILGKIGDVQSAQGQNSAALRAYKESLNISRDLAAQDPGNADWARSVWVTQWRIAQIDRANAAEHWAAVVTSMEDMEANGTLLSGDMRLLATARQIRAAAR